MSDPVPLTPKRIQRKRTKGWLAPNGKVYRGEWTHPSVLLLMGVLPPNLYERAHSPTMLPEEMFALRWFRGTGQFVGKDARMKTKAATGRWAWETLMVLRARGFLEFAWCDQWYLTDAGREQIRKGTLEIANAD